MNLGLPGEQYLPDILPSVKFGEWGIRMCSCFSGVGLGPLVPVKVTLNASAYQYISDNFLFPNFVGTG